jgi:hypothetical protein
VVDGFVATETPTACCHRDASRKALMIDVFATHASIAMASWKKSQNCPLAVPFRHHRAFCWPDR